MSQRLRTYVWLAVWAAVAWSFAPAEAQYIESRGRGDHLLFAYWSVEDDTNTNVAVHRHRGVREQVSEEAPSVAQVAVRDRMGKIATEFKICLMPGDSWTATLTAAGLRVGSPGACDEKIHQGGSTRTGQLVVTPKPGEVVTLGSATSGWLDVWKTPANTLKDGADADTEPDHVPNSDLAVLGGVATLVSPGAGFASSYNAVALRGCGDWVNILGDGYRDSNAGERGYRSWQISATYPDRDRDATNDRVDTGDGCWNTDRDGDGVVGEQKTGSSADWDEVDPISEALTDVVITSAGKRLLVGEWTALDDANVQTHTKVVITFPQTPLRYEGQKTAGGAKVMATDPVSILVFDVDGELALDSREVLLDQDVNVCTFLPQALAMEETMGLNPGLSCNGRRVGGLQGATSGTFRFFNNTAVTLDGAGLVTNDGTEATDLSVKKATAGANTGDPPTRPKGGQVPDGNYRFPMIGLVFSYFRGTDGREYDQIVPLRGDSLPVQSDPAGTAEDARTDNPRL